MEGWNEQWWSAASAILSEGEQSRFATRCRWCGHSPGRFQLLAATALIGLGADHCAARLIRVVDRQNRVDRIYLDNAEFCWLERFEHDLRTGIFRAGRHLCSDFSF